MSALVSMSSARCDIGGEALVVDSRGTVLLEMVELRSSPNGLR